uniref:Uncharacterized protein n=1 Tax=Arundo donax TaxID=35708 RepID=A0A0A9ENN5_ARUDO
MGTVFVGVSRCFIVKMKLPFVGSPVRWGVFHWEMLALAT